MTKRRPTIGSRIRALRLERGLSQEELARRASLNRGTIAKIETGQRLDPGASTLMALAAALGVRMEELTEAARAPRDPGLEAFLASPWAKALEAEGKPITPAEEKLIEELLRAHWPEGSPTPKTLYTILAAYRGN